jgi:hypothetical protein
MGCLINARNLPEHGFLEVTRLARTVPAFSLRYGDFAQLEQWVVTLEGSSDPFAGGFLADRGIDESLSIE